MSAKVYHILTRIALALAAAATLSYLLLLGYYALPTADDWGWARQATDLNPFGFVNMFYFGWQGRFSALLVDGTLCKYLGWNEHLLIFTMVELLLGYGAVYLLLRDLARIPRGYMLIVATVLIVNLGVMAFPEIGTFYWLCTANYVHEIWLTLYLIWFIFCCQRVWLQWIGAFLCAVYLGGCAENYSPVLALVLGCAWLYRLYQSRDWRFWKDMESLLLLVSTAVIGIGSLFMILAPGNDVRMASEGSYSMMNHFSFPLFVLKTCKASIVLLLRLLSRGWYFVCAFPLFVMLGATAVQPLPQPTWLRVVVSLVLAIGVIVVSVAATVYGVGWYATMRANCFIVFIMLAWMGYVGVLLGYQLHRHAHGISIAVIAASLAVCITSGVYMAEEGPVVRKYHQDVMAVRHQLQQHVSAGRTEPVVVQPVAIASRQSSYGYLRNALQVVFHKQKRYQEHYFPYEPFRLTPDSHDWRNQFYQRWLGAEFDIICVDEKNE